MTKQRADRITRLAKQLHEELQLYIDGTVEERERFAHMYAYTLDPLQDMIAALTEMDQAKREERVTNIRLADLVNGAVIPKLMEHLNKQHASKQKKG